MTSRVALFVALLALCLPAVAAARRSDVAADGTIYVSGPFTTLPLEGSPFGGPPHVFGLLRARPDGTRVDSFGRGGFIKGSWNQIAALPGGGVAGVFLLGGKLLLTRFDDRGRQVGGGSVASPMSVVDDIRALGDGRVLVSGLRQEPTAWRLVVAVLRADGSLDPGFGDGGVAISRGTLDQPSLAGPGSGRGAVPGRTPGGAPAWVLPDGRILVGGPGLVARFTPSGAPDPTWGGDGEVTVGSHEGIVAPSTDGESVYVLEVADGVTVHRLTSGGLPDAAWGDGGTATHAISGGGAIKDARALPDGRLAFLVWPGPFADAYPAVPYLLSADGSMLAVGATAKSIGESDLFALGGTPAVIGPAGERFVISRYDSSLQPGAVTPLDIVSTAPAVSITGHPSTQLGAVTGATAHFRFAVEQRPEDLGLGAVVCGETPVPCGPDLTFHLHSEGPQVLIFRGESIHGSLGPMQDFLWTADFAAPNTMIRSRPPAVTRHTTARITFRTSEKATTRCSLDGHRARPCHSPLRLRGLHRGRHRLAIRASDVYQADERHAAVVRWRVSSSRRR